MVEVTIIKNWQIRLWY